VERTVYVQFASKAAARTALQTVGARLDQAGIDPTSDDRIVMVYGTTEWITRPTYSNGVMTDPGQQRTGFWVMARFNLDTAVGLAAYNAVIASGRVQTLATPSMTDDSPFQDKVRKAADSAMLTFVARWAMVVTLPIGGFIGAAVYTKLDKTSESAARLEEQVKALVGSTIPQLTIQLDGRFNSLSDRVTAHDRRLDRLEDWRKRSCSRRCGSTS
jgi:hypothetical protein